MVDISAPQNPFGEFCLSLFMRDTHPPVIHLNVHLENFQRVIFTTDNIRDKILNPQNTTLMAFFKLCQTDEFSKTLLYEDVPLYYMFNKHLGNFTRRKKGTPVEGFPGIKRQHVIGRVYAVHPNNTECFYLWMLLHTVRGPTSFNDLRTVEGVLHLTYQSACRALGLLEDDSHWDETLREAFVSYSPSKLHQLFHYFSIL